MKNEYLKIILAESLERECELASLCKEMLKEIFPDMPFVIYEFENDLQAGREYNGCFQSLEYYKSQAKRHMEHIKNQDG